MENPLQHISAVGVFQFQKFTELSLREYDGTHKIVTGQAKEAGTFLRYFCRTIRQHDGLRSGLICQRGGRIPHGEGGSVFVITEAAFHLIDVGVRGRDGKKEGDGGRSFVDVDKIFGGAGKLCIKRQDHGVRYAGLSATGGAEDAEKPGGGQGGKIDGLFFTVTVDAPQGQSEWSHTSLLSVSSPPMIS